MLRLDDERLHDDNEQLRGENQQLRQDNRHLRDAIARLKKNSSNSSKPPKDPPRRGRKRTIGGQPGHSGHQRPPFDATRSIILVSMSCRPRRSGVEGFARSSSGACSSRWS